MYIGNRYQFKEYDSYLINHENKDSKELILEAATLVFPYVYKEEKTVIFAGKGNNGADGLSLSCLMKKNNQDVCVIFLGDVDNMQDNIKFYLSSAIALGVQVYPAKEIDETLETIIRNQLSSATLVVDAIFGFGFIGSLAEKENRCVTLINDFYQGRVLSIDVPSGLDSDSGVVANNAIIADITVSFVACKLGFLNPAAKKYLGQLTIEKLEVDPTIEDKVGMAKYFTDKDAINLINQRDFHEHKYNRGKTLHITGCNQYKGASQLAAKGALTSGVGLVSVCSNFKVLSTINVALPEVISIDEEKIKIAKDIDNYKSTLFGSGLGSHKNLKQQLEEILSYNQNTTIIDGDGINCIAQNLELLHVKKGPVILTPHFGEFRRLVPDTQDSTMAAIEFAKAYDVIVILKGANTLITDGHNTYRNSTGNPAMATAGMGDVLAGIVSSFVAQGYGNLNACLLAVYIHGLSGDHLAENSYTVLASSLADYLPIVMKELLKKKNKNDK